MRLVAVIIALLGVLAAGCAGDGSPAARQAALVPEAGEAPHPTRTPIELSVTPELTEHTAADPAFEALPGARAVWGEYEGGIYQIEVPDEWNGDVVYYTHGFRGYTTILSVNAPSLREDFIRQGYAWAASSYSKNGYEPGAGAEDTYALREVFAREAGTPKRSYLYGESMGGHVIGLLLEQHVNVFDGALSVCGVVSGNDILDYFVSWGALAGYFSGVDLWALTGDGEAFADALGSDVVPLLMVDGTLTDAGRAFKSTVHHLTGGARPFFEEGFAFSFGTNFGILSNALRNSRTAHAAGQNVDARYEIDDGFGVNSGELNGAVARILGDPRVRDRARYPEFADMRGGIRDPHLTLHNTGDLFVPISLQQSYRQAVDSAGRGDLLVQRAIRRAGHCAFTQDELRTAFDDLVAWVETGERPAGDDLSGDLSNVGLEFTHPLEPSDPGGLRP